MGARMPLVAYNVNLDTDDIEIANQIAKRVRHISGGLRYCKGIGIELKDRGIVQVSLNMTDYTRTALYRVFELIKVEARRYGVNVIGSEIVGLVPMEALIDAATMFSDDLMEAVLEEKNIPVEQLIAALRTGVLSREITPVMMGSAYKNKGIQLLLDAVNNYLPCPAEVENVALDTENDEAPVVLKSKSDEPLVALAFKLEDGQ